LRQGFTARFYAREFWRFVQVQQQVAARAETAVNYPPMQAPASFNLEAVKRQVQEMLKEHEGQQDCRDGRCAAVAHPLSVRTGHGANSRQGPQPAKWRLRCAFIW
jgi:hypothetical protein